MFLTNVHPFCKIWGLAIASPTLCVCSCPAALFASISPMFVALSYYYSLSGSPKLLLTVLYLHSPNWLATTVATVGTRDGFQSHYSSNDVDLVPTISSPSSIWTFDLISPRVQLFLAKTALFFIEIAILSSESGFALFRSITKPNIITTSSIWASTRHSVLEKVSICALCINTPKPTPYF